MVIGIPKKAPPPVVTEPPGWLAESWNMHSTKSLPGLAGGGSDPMLMEGHFTLTYDPSVYCCDAATIQDRFVPVFHPIASDPRALSRSCCHDRMSTSRG